MARKRVEIAWIANEAARRATYRKRSKVVMKKVSEVATLCGVTACAILYGSERAPPDFWPSFEGVMQALARFRSSPGMEQRKKMMNQEGFLRQQLTKLRKKLWKQEREVRELETTVLLLEGLAGRSLHDVGIEAATNLVWMIERKAEAVQERIRHIKAQMASGGAALVGGAGVEPAVEAVERQNGSMEVMSPTEFLAFDGEVIPQLGIPKFGPYLPWN